ncbi:MAG: hypothetical protein JRN73_09140 [Nitrososphaerota archaeon]|nr:hypothetical protein [Nitrososphaerota archaeon]
MGRQIEEMGFTKASSKGQMVIPARIGKLNDLALGVRDGPTARTHLAELRAQGYSVVWSDDTSRLVLRRRGPKHNPRGSMMRDLMMQLDINSRDDWESSKSDYGF